MKLQFKFCLAFLTTGRKLIDATHDFTENCSESHRSEPHSNSTESRRSPRKGYKGKTIGMKLRYADFQTVTRDTTFGFAVDDAESIRYAVRSCLKRVPLDARLRLLGVRIAALISAEQANDTNSKSSAANHPRGQSLSLFD